MAYNYPDPLWTKHTYGEVYGVPGSTQLSDKEIAADEAYNAMLEKLNPAATTPTTLRTAMARPTISPGPSYMSAKGVGGATGATTGGIGTATPTLNLPEYDMGKVEALAQRAAAPGVRSLRSAMQGVQQGYYENPNVKRMTLRDALAGYGQGLETVMGGAMKTGAGIYGTEYAAGLTKATTEFGAGEARALQTQRISAEESMQAASIASNEKLAQYQNEWREYLASLT